MIQDSPHISNTCTKMVMQPFSRALL